MSSRERSPSTGTWLPTDNSSDSEVSLQGVDFRYRDICTPSAIAEHSKKLDSLRAEKEMEEKKLAKLAEDKKRAISERFTEAKILSEAV